MRTSTTICWPRRFRQQSFLTISLECTAKRWCFTGLLLLAVASACFESGKLGLAWTLAHSSHPGDWVRAAAIEPNNAEYWHRLAEEEQWNFQHDHLRQAVTYYEKATEINPHSAPYWMDLGSAHEMLGEFDHARNAFEQARRKQPASGEVAWRYGNFLLRQQTVSAASAELHRSVVADPDLTASVVAECWNAGISVDRILEEVLPAQRRAYLVALDYFVSQKQTDPALAVWNHLLNLKQPLDLAQLVPLVDALLEQDRIEDADHVWRQLLSATGRQGSAAAGADSSLVFDGGFEHPPSNGGFGWRQLVVAGASVTLDSAVFHSGNQSLRITFDGSANVDFSHVLQLVRVLPGRRYRFSAYLRTQELSTDSGMRVLLSDFRHRAVLHVLTEDLVGTIPWTRVEQEFITAPQTNLLEISLRRIPTWKFDNKLHGSVWIDDVSLVPASDEPQENHR